MAKMKMLFALIALSCLAYCEELPDYQETCGISSFNQSSGNALSFIAVSFAIVSLSIGLAYMYSKIKEDPAIGVWAKDEALNVGISMLLFFGIIAFFSASCTLAQEYANGNPILLSQQYLDYLILKNGLDLAKELSFGSLQNQLDSARFIYIGLTPFFGSGVSPKANLRAHSSHKEYLIDLYLPIIASLNAQKYILQGIAWVGASVLLPFAFIMRLIPPTRDFGNMLIALFFGLYIIVPTMYAMSGKVFMENIIEKTPYTTDSSLNKFTSYALDNAQNPVNPPYRTVFYKIGSTLPQAIFLPNLVIVVVVSCVMALSKALKAIAV